MNHVVCVKWGIKYPSQYANVLYNMVKRHTTVPFEFHCLTDDPAGLDPEINVIKLPNDPWVKSWWSKLWMFAPEMPLKGNILFFDLDVVIFNNIDNLFTLNPGKFMIIKDFNRCRINDWTLSNSSCMRWEAGTMDYLWKEFKDRSAQIMQNNHGDQDWISKRAKNDINWWPENTVRSYKWELVGWKNPKLLSKDGKWFFNTPTKIEPGNNVAVFHGKPNPENSADPFVVENWK